MRKILFAALFMISTVASAQWMNANAFCTYTAAEGRCQVVNNTIYPVYCAGRVDGVTFYGAYLTNWMDTWVPAGTTAFISVYSPRANVDPIVRVQQFIQCRF